MYFINFHFIETFESKDMRAAPHWDRPLTQYLIKVNSCFFNLTYSRTPFFATAQKFYRRWGSIGATKAKAPLITDNRVIILLSGQRSTFNEIQEVSHEEVNSSALAINMPVNGLPNLLMVSHGVKFWIFISFIY